MNVKMRSCLNTKLMLMSPCADEAVMDTIHTTPPPEKKDNHMGAFLSLVSEIFSELDKNKSESKFVF